MSEIENQETATRDTAAFSLENIRNEHTEGLGDYWDSELNYASNLQAIFESSIVIPDKDIQLPMLLAYICIPSALSSVVPILFLHGKAGTGKSQTIIFASGVHNAPIYTTATTYAALRNSVQATRWIVPKNEEGEKNYIVLFDNLNRETLINENLKTFMLCGYNRRTDRIEISKGEGENQTFRVFGPKVISSIHPVYSDSSMSELARRLVVLKFQSLDNMSPKDIGDFDIYDRLDLETVDLSLLNHQFNILWGIDNQHEFMNLSARLKARKKDFKVPKIIKSTQWALMPDMIASGIIAGVWKDLEDALHGCAKYWEWNAENIAMNMGSMERAIRHYIEAETKAPRELSKRLAIPDLSEIRCDSLKIYLDSLAKQGALEAHATPSKITETMLAVGWTRQLNDSKTWVWVPQK
jgi:hypothetical protein